MAEYLKRRSKRSRATEDIMQLNFGKNNKLYSLFESEYCSDVESPPNASSPASSCCNCDHSTEVRRRQLRSSDLEDVDLRSESFGTAISASISFNFSREATPSIALCGDSQQVMLMASPSVSTEKPISPPPASTQRKISASAAKKPSAAELEEFFAEAEEYVHKRFAEKYNYDIMKDAPILGGRSRERGIPGCCNFHAWSCNCRYLNEGP